MRGSAIVRGSEATGVSAFAGREGAGCGVGVGAGATGGGVLPAQPARRARKMAKRRMDLHTAKKTPPRSIPRGRSVNRWSRALRQDEADHHAAVAQTAFRGG